MNSEDHLQIKHNFQQKLLKENFVLLIKLLEYFLLEMSYKRLLLIDNQKQNHLQIKRNFQQKLLQENLVLVIKLLEYFLQEMNYKRLLLIDNY